MKKISLKEKSEKELHDLFIDSKKKLGEFRFNIPTGKVKNVKEGREIRKNIARILTELKIQSNKK